jgi:hypothetical protein
VSQDRYALTFTMNHFLRRDGPLGAGYFLPIDGAMEYTSIPVHVAATWTSGPDGQYWDDVVIYVNGNELTAIQLDDLGTETCSLEEHALDKLSDWLFETVPEKFDPSP